MNNPSISLTRRGWQTFTQGDVTAYVRGQAHIGDRFFDTAALAREFVSAAGSETLFDCSDCSDCSITSGRVERVDRVDRSAGKGGADNRTIEQSEQSNNLKSQINQLDALVRSLNGTWAAVVETPAFTYLAVDHVRSIQLLYAIDQSEHSDNRTITVFDDLVHYRKSHSVELDESCAHEYLSSGYTYRDHTLFKNTHSLQAGERVVINRTIDQSTNPVSSLRYWRYIPNLNRSAAQDDELFRRVDKCFEDSMRRLVESAAGKRIVVPLSGGCDSRLIVSYLHRLLRQSNNQTIEQSNNRIICYTYGVPGNPESTVSKRIADALGLEWHFVETTPERYREVLTDDSYLPAIRYMSNGANRPCFQEYFAVRSLKEQGVLNPETDVICPGYYFDYLAGSHVNLCIPECFVPSEICEWENNFFIDGCFRRTVCSISKVFSEHQDLTKRQFMEGWSWQERLAKFIVNAVRTYEWLGFEWRLPVCDHELFDLWLSIPTSMRYRRNYFFSILPQLMEPEIRDDTPLGVRGDTSFKARLVDVFNTRAPYFFKRYIRKAIGKEPRFDTFPFEVKNLPHYLVRRLSGRSSVSSNAALSLKALKEELER